MPCMWNEWLPEPLATRVRTEEPLRFAALIQALASLWQQEKSIKPIDEAATETLPYVPLVKAMLNAKAEPDVSHLQLLAETLLDIVLTCHVDLAAQARWGALLNRVLRSYRRKLKLTIHWKPLYKMLRQQNMEPSLSYEGIGVSQARNKHLMLLIYRSRRFFPAGSAAEIWAEFSPQLRDLSSPDAFEALGWLALFMPTQAATRRDGDWATWAGEWMELWGSVTHVHYWQALWMGLFARLIRHDIHGLVDWPKLVPELCNRFLWAFNLPVGSATSSPPFSGTAPGMCASLFGDYIGSRTAAAAHSFIYLIGRCPEGTPADEDAALGSLESTVALLEQYYHPSNGGKWTGGLALFLRETAGHLCQRLVTERGGTAEKKGKPSGDRAGGACNDFMDQDLAEDSEEEYDDDSDEEDGSDNDDNSEGEESGFCEDESDGEEGVVTSANGDMVGNGDNNKRNSLSNATTTTSPISPSARRPMTRETARRIVAALVKLATKGQSSKDGHMKRYSSVVLSLLAHVAPDLVLPFIHRHFVTALETVTAARQYGNAIQTLSLCIRPLLLAGLPSSNNPESIGTASTGNAPSTTSGGWGAGSAFCTTTKGSTTPATTTTDIEMTETIEEMRANAARSVASALMATLPGIDANDPPKSLAVFRLYCCVLSCSGELPETPGDANTPGTLPLYTEEWVFELLSRIFTVIGNLDAPDAGAEHGGREDGSSDGSTFLLEGSSMFRPLMELLYMRLPGPLKTVAIKKTAKFLLESSFSSVTSEAAILCNAMAWADPGVSAEALLLPLLTALEKDAEAAAADGGGTAGGGITRLSRVAENSFKWRLSLLSSTAYRLGPALVPHGGRVRAILASMAAAKSQTVQEAAARALASVIQGLCTYYPLEQCAACTARLMPASVDGGAMIVEAYVDQTGGGLHLGGDGNGGGKQPTGAHGGSATTTNSMPIYSGGMKWHIPSDAEIALTNELLQDFAEQPAKFLIEAIRTNSPSTNNTTTNGNVTSSSSSSSSVLPKEMIRAQLLQLEGALGGARSCLPDFPGCNLSSLSTEATTIPTTNSQPVSVIGSLGPTTVGSPALRVLISQALVAVVSKAILPSDSETLFMCLRLMEIVLCAGDAEHRDASAAATSWGSDERWMHEPAVAGLLLESLGDVYMSSTTTTIGGTGGSHITGNNNNNKVDIGDVMMDTSNGGGGGGGDASASRQVGYGNRWRRRRPMWVAQEKVYLNMEWRASQAAYRWYPTVATPAVPMNAIPSAYVELLAQGVHVMLTGMRGVREIAGGLVERCLKRYPVLTPVVAAPMLCGIAKIQDSLEMNLDVTAPDVIDKLKEAAVGAAAKAAAAIAAGETIESDQEQAMACGGAALLRGIACWRYFTRNWDGIRALFLALLAGAAHTGIEAQANLSMVTVVAILKYMRPPGGTMVTGLSSSNSAVVASAATGDICEHAAAAALGRNGGPPLPWRYAVTANCYPLLVLPAMNPTTAASLVHHYVSILDSEIPISRQIGAGGLAALTLFKWNPQSESENAETAPHGGSLPENVKIAVWEALTTALRSSSSSTTTTETPSQNSLVVRLISSWSNSHPALAAGSDAQRATLMQQFKDDAIPKTILANLMKGDWPGGRSSIPSVSRAHFLVVHARLIHIFCLSSPENIIPAAKTALEEILAKPQDVDRSAVATAAEVLAGILASGAVFEGPWWGDWVKDMFVKAMAVAPLEIVDIWCAALRFALYELEKAGKEEYVGILLDATLALRRTKRARSGVGSLADPSSSLAIATGGATTTTSLTATIATATGATLYKDMTYAREAVEELVVTQSITGATPTLRSLLGDLLEQLPVLIKAHGEMVRQAAADLAAEVCLSLLLFKKDEHTPQAPLPDADVESIAIRNEELSQLRSKAVEFLEHVASEFDAATGVLYEHAMSTAAGSTAAGMPSIETGDQEILAAANAAINAVRGRQASQELEEEEDIEEEEEEEEEEGDTDTGEINKESAEAVAPMDVEESLAGLATHDAPFQAAVAQVAFSVEWIVQLLASNLNAAAPWITRVMPSLLRLQELVPSELQFVALVARKALIAAKYQPFLPSETPTVLHALRSASSVELWPERAAALIFAQYFWFRHTLLLGRQGTGEIVDMVLQRLEDEKLEVRELAANSLSGLVRGLPENDAAELRRKFLSRANEIFPTRGRRRRTREQLESGSKIAAATIDTSPATSSSSSSSVPVRHGTALALQALVLSSPYDVPLWLPDVLMALVRLASEPAPIKTTVTKALGEFRRTHEEGGLVEVKEVLSGEQWEAIRDVASPASYFV
ncbi:hypothetical protein Ndes2526B_g03845 [Nannochloris sp. 'desiccata']|nr:putative Proteasome activator subunit 4 [Chlorella desiccata (nom. nud.)]